MARRSTLPTTTQRNIESIAQVEQQLLSHRPMLQRLGDAIAHFFGSIWFIAAQVLLIIAWMLWNLPPERIARIQAAVGVWGPLIHLLNRPHRLFDPYPYPLLALLIDVEFLLLTTFVLMNQKHASRRNEHWAHLHLQLSMLTEQEVTKNLQMLDSICTQLGCHAGVRDRQLAELSQPKRVTEMVDELEKSRSSLTGDAPTIAEIKAIDDEVQGLDEAQTK